MMSPDVRIAIAYGSSRSKEVANTIVSELRKLSTDGYPVSVEFVDNKRDEFITKMRLDKGLADAGDSDVFLAAAMEKAFMDFDCAIFLFDHRNLVSYSDKEKQRGALFKDEEHTECDKCDSCKKIDKCKELVERNGGPFNLVSGNLLFEYGMATSVFHNRKIQSKGSPVVSFAFSDLNQKLYAFRLDPIRLFGKENDEITDIILKYIHKHFVEPRFYEINGEWEERKDNSFKDPMALSDKNTYFPNLETLIPTGVSVSLDKESSALREVFKDEYKRLLPENKRAQNSRLWVRRLLYIVDRAVLLMYLDKGVDKNNREERDYWYNQAGKLLSDLDEVSIEPDEYKEYLSNTADAVKSILGYQDRKERNETLEQISQKLLPIYKLGREKGNRMVFALCADYLGLCYLNGIWDMFKELKNAGGMAAFHDGLDIFSSENMTSLCDLLRDQTIKNTNHNTLLAIVNRLIKAIIAFDDVMKCQDSCIGAHSKISTNIDKWYIWKSYASYNKARCEYLLYFIQECSGDDFSDVFSKNVCQADISKNWYETLRSSVNFRQIDYEHAGRISGFPQVLTFNFQAEYFLALYCYRALTLITAKLFPDFRAVEIENAVSIKRWTDSSVYLGDTINVLGVETKYKNILNEQTRLVCEKIKNHPELSEKQKKSFIENVKLTEQAELSKDQKKVEEARDKWSVLEISNFILETIRTAAPYIGFYLKYHI
jgi:hypothetical protein